VGFVGDAPAVDNDAVECAGGLSFEGSAVGGT
jgi:hypothetical protein